MCDQIQLCHHVILIIIESGDPQVQRSILKLQGNEVYSWDYQTNHAQTKPQPSHAPHIEKWPIHRPILLFLFSN